MLKYAYLLQRENPDSRVAAELLDRLLVVIEAQPRLGTGGHGNRDVQILALQGRPDEALARLRQAFDEGFRGSRAYDNWSLSQDPYLESIRDTDEYRSIEADIAAAIDIMKRRVNAARANNDFEPILLSTTRGRTS